MKPDPKKLRRFPTVKHTPPKGFSEVVRGIVNHNANLGDGKRNNAYGKIGNVARGPWRVTFDKGATPILEERGWQPNVTRHTFTILDDTFFEARLTEKPLKGGVVHKVHDDGGHIQLILTRSTTFITWMEEDKDGQPTDIPVCPTSYYVPCYLMPDGSVQVPVPGTAELAGRHMTFEEIRAAKAPVKKPTKRKPRKKAEAGQSPWELLATAPE